MGQQKIMDKTIEGGIGILFLHLLLPTWNEKDNPVLGQGVFVLFFYNAKILHGFIYTPYTA